MLNGIQGLKLRLCNCNGNTACSQDQDIICNKMLDDTSVRGIVLDPWIVASYDPDRSPDRSVLNGVEDRCQRTTHSFQEAFYGKTGHLLYRGIRDKDLALLTV